jgi:hypothetical protein
MTPDELRLRVAADALADAWMVGSRIYWERRARQLEAARPRPGDYAGRANRKDLTDRHLRLTAAAAACRRRATGLDDLVRVQLVETLEDLGRRAG